MHCVPSSFWFMATSEQPRAEAPRRPRDLSCSHYKHNSRTEFTVTLTPVSVTRFLSSLNSQTDRARAKVEGRREDAKKILPSRSLDRQTRHSSPSALFPRLRSCLMSRFPAPSLAIGPRVSDSIVRVFFRNYLISHRVTHGCHRTTIHFRSLSLFDSMSLGSPSLPS